MIFLFLGLGREICFKLKQHEEKASGKFNSFSYMWGVICNTL